MNAQLQLLVFVLEERKYALYLSQVQRVVRAVDVTPLPGAPDIVLGAIDLQGTIVSLFNVRRRFGLIEREISLDDQFIIASTSQRTVALVVDRVTEIVEAPAEQIIAVEMIVDRLELIAGVIQLEAGMALIHDLERFLSLSETNALEEALARQSTHGSHGA